jgi:subtilase family serine protease
MRLRLASTVVLISSFAFAQQAQQQRIVRPVNNASAVRLQGTMAPRAHADLDRGPVASSLRLDRMTMVFSRTAAQQAELDQLLVAQHDPNSADYRRWLTPEEFGDRFGLADADIQLVGAWLTAQGFSVEEIARSRTWIAFSGTAAQVETAFHAPLHNYLVGGQMHYAPSTEAAVPDAIAPVVAAITGLNDFRPRLHSTVRHVDPRLTSSLSGNHFLVPGDFGTIYNLPDYVNGVFQSGNDGTGQTIGIVGQATDTTTNGITSIALSSDNVTFRSLAGLPAGNLSVTPVGSPNNFTSADFSEASLDIQWSGAVAPNANIVFAYSQNALSNSLQFLVNQNVASVISISYGDCEADWSSGATTTVEGYLAQANAQGQAVTAAAGDTGAADCDGTPQNPVAVATHGLAVDYPASSVYVTGMGGTVFFGDLGSPTSTQFWLGSSDPNNTSPSALSYIPETVWNDTNILNVNVGTGGGVSKKFSKPSWQNNNGVPSSVDSGMRDVPDLAFAASSSHDGYIICSQGSCQTGYRRNSDQTFTVIGGTSAAAPAFAGVAALVNQGLGGRQGNLNPQLYNLLQLYPLPGSTVTSWAFNDILGGDNIVQCQPSTPDCPSFDLYGYSAFAGYDLVTGWGSVDATALLNALSGSPNPHFVLLPPVIDVSVAAGNTNGIVPLSVVSKQGFTGNIALSCSVSSSLAGVTCYFDNPTVNTSGSARLVISPGPSQGAQTGTVTVQGTSGSNTASMIVNMSFTVPDFQLSSGNTTEAVSTGGSTTDTVSVTSLQGFIGSVSYVCSGTTGLACSLSPNPVVTNQSSAVPSTLTVTASSSATSGSVTITATSNGITHTLQIPVTVNVVAPSFTLTVASPVVSIPSGIAITDTLTVAPIGGFGSDVALTCSVPGSLGTTSCTISPPTVVGGSGTAQVTLKGAVLSRDLGAPLPFRHRGLGIYASYVFSLGFVFLGAPVLRSRRRRTGTAWVGILKKALFTVLVLSIMFGALSCGGGGNSGGGGTGSNPTPISGNVTITGTGGGITQSATINVTVY